MILKTKQTEAQAKKFTFLNEEILEKKYLSLYSMVSWFLLKERYFIILVYLPLKMNTLFNINNMAKHHIGMRLFNSLCL